MYKKLTKTIALIVFVVFLGMNKVEAGTYKTCLYKSGSKSASVSINESFYNADVTESSFGNGNIKAVVNWSEYITNSNNKKFGSKIKSKFLGQEYFVNNNLSCPPIAVVAEFTFNTYLYLGTSDIESDIKKDIDYMKKLTPKVSVLNLASELKGDDYFEYGKDSSSYTITTKTCKCSGTDNHVKLSVSFEVTDNLTIPRPKVKVGDDSNKELIANWVKPINGSNYSYYSQLISNDSCPDYAIFAHTNGFGDWCKKIWNGDIWADNSYLAVSDEANKSSVINAVKSRGYSTTHVVSCEQTSKKPEEPAEPEEPEEPEEPDEPIYEDPTVDPNIVGPLHSSIDTYSCGHNFITGIPQRIISIVRFIYTFIQVLVPVAIIILGLIDLIKAIAGQKEDEIKKGQQTFIKRLIGAAIVFFVFAIVKFVISIVNAENQPIIDCMECFLTSDSACVRE